MKVEEEVEEQDEIEVEAEVEEELEGHAPRSGWEREGLFADDAWLPPQPERRWN